MRLPVAFVTHGGGPLPLLGERSNAALAAAMRGLPAALGLKDQPPRAGEGCVCSLATACACACAPAMRGLPAALDLRDQPPRAGEGCAHTRSLCVSLAATCS